MLTKRLASQQTDSQKNLEQAKSVVHRAELALRKSKNVQASTEIAQAANKFRLDNVKESLVAVVEKCRESVRSKLGDFFSKADIDNALHAAIGQWYSDLNKFDDRDVDWIDVAMQLFEKERR